ncbi:cyclic GMP-AMP synthase-like receptor 1 isoform X2 [Neocloeon triangulifer]|nr:cyclic GMP-AMP synthase-like receptor 1 isoform X2 [Neocloeon triangulifer]XP_059482449.1 cyclic GMP-AMP synthase-like receptor 1 isoform X2 [Neocloeon triangulifer]
MVNPATNRKNGRRKKVPKQIVAQPANAHPFSALRINGRNPVKHPFPLEETLAVSRGKINTIPALQQVLQTIRIDDDCKQDSKTIIHDLIKNNLIKIMKEKCEIFKKHYRDLAFVGSFYEGLKITDADEFDLNIVMKLPFGAHTPYEVCQVPKAPGHMSIKWDPKYLKKIEKSCSENIRPTFKWVDAQGYLLTNKILQYMESLVAKSVAEYNSELYEEDQISITKNGPALTLWHQSEDISVDLVPAFDFPARDCPPPPFKDPSMYCHPRKNMRWFIVPKPLKQHGLEIAWRLSFSEHEREILYDLGWVKPAIKIMKRIRDIMDWRTPDSYSLKTVALWLLDYGYLTPDDKLDFAFEKMARGLMYYLDKKKLPLFWDPRFNKFEDMNPADCKNKFNFLDKYLRSEKDIVELCELAAEDSEDEDDEFYD